MVTLSESRRKQPTARRALGGPRVDDAGRVARFGNAHQLLSSDTPHFHDPGVKMRDFYFLSSTLNLNNRARSSMLWAGRNDQIALSRMFRRWEIRQSRIVLDGCVWI
jgi:hypothetical protein